MSTKIESIKIRNFKGLSKVEQSLNGSNVFVVGGNGKGKTSFIDAVWNTLTGKNIPTEPIKKGENESTIEVELSEYIAILEFKRNAKDQIKTTFKLISKNDGEVVAQPRTVLNQLVGIIDFNPNHFFELSANKQVEYFCQLTGIDFSEIDRKIAMLYEERTYRNKELNRLKGDANVWFDEEIANSEPVNINDLFEKKIAEMKRRDNFVHVSSGIDQRRSKIAELKKEIEFLNQQVAENEKQIIDGESWLSDEKNIPISDQDFQLLESKIASAENDNKTINEHKAARDNSEKLKKAENDVRDIEKEMSELKEMKRNQLSESIDIPNLSFDGERFLFGGLPFENTQINTANQLIAGLRIGLKMLKDVRILKFDGSLIDDNNMKEIQDWSTKNNVQLFIEQVDRSGGKLEIHVTESTDGK